MIAAAMLSPETLTVGWMIYVPVLIWAIARAPWVELFTDSRRQLAVRHGVRAVRPLAGATRLRYRRALPFYRHDGGMRFQENSERRQLS